MLTKIFSLIRRQSLGAIALFVALGGSGYAAINLPAGSVGSKQLRSGAVTNKKLAKGSVGAADLDRKSIAGYVRAYVQINGQGQILSSRPAAKILVWRTDPQNGPGGLIQWSQPIPATCFALATTNTQAGAVSYASAQLASGGAKHNAQSTVLLSAAGQPVNVAIICPQS
jgi:hypothetical protein